MEEILLAAQRLGLLQNLIDALEGDVGEKRNELLLRRGQGFLERFGQLRIVDSLADALQEPLVPFFIQTFIDVYCIDAAESFVDVAGDPLDRLFGIWIARQRRRNSGFQEPLERVLPTVRLLRLRIMERLIGHGIGLPSVGGAASPTVRGRRRRGPSSYGPRPDIRCSAD